MGPANTYRGTVATRYGSKKKQKKQLKYMSKSFLIFDSRVRGGKSFVS